MPYTFEVPMTEEMWIKLSAKLIAGTINICGGAIMIYYAAKIARWGWDSGAKKNEAVEEH